MKPVLVFFFACILAGLSFLFGTMRGEVTVAAPPAEWTQNRDVAEAWKKFLVTLEAGAARVYDVTDDPREQIDGVRYISHLASAALEMKLAKGSPSEPAFTDWMLDYRKFLGDSPDARYRTAEISADHEYLIKGNRNDVSYLGFALYGKSLNGWNRAAENISTPMLATDAEGNFSLLLSKERPAGYLGSWLRLDDDIHMVMVREYFHNRESARAAEFSIRTRDSIPYVLDGSEQVASQIDRATTFFHATLSGTVALIEMLQKAPNSFDVPKEYSAEFGGVFYPTQDNSYFGTWFSLADDEVLVVQGKAPEVEYWSISIQNRWLQSLDYKHYPGISLNNHSINVESDGSYTVYVSSRPIPGRNWIDTAGFNEGLLSIRYQLATEAKSPVSKVVSRRELLAAEQMDREITN